MDLASNVALASIADLGLIVAPALITDLASIVAPASTFDVALKGRGFKPRRKRSKISRGFSR
jgi:hypothetical protein